MFLGGMKETSPCNCLKIASSKTIENFRKVIWKELVQQLIFNELVGLLITKGSLS